MPPTPRPPSVSKIGTVSLDHTVAQAQAPAKTSGQGENRLRVYTYLTKIADIGQTSAPVLYNGDRMWARVTLTLETAGPVAVSDQSDITPVLSGKGQILETGVPTPFDVAKGNRIFIACDSVNRVKVKIEAYPWLETIVGIITSMIGGAVGGAVATVANATSKLTSKL